MAKITLKFGERQGETKEFIISEFECSIEEVEGWMRRILHSKINNIQVINLGEYGSLIDADLKSCTIEF
jgi:hypothetical protein